MQYFKNYFFSRFLLILFGGLVFLTSCEEDEQTDPDTDVSITADAGADITVDVGDQVILDGSNSSISEGSLTYSWQFSSKPGTSNAQLQDATSVDASFTPDVGGEYIVTLTASDGQGESDQDEVTVAANSDVVKITEDITTDETWTTGTLYRVMNEIDVESGAKLTIEPGVTVEFVEHAGLSVSSDNSVLVAAGTEEQPIILTGEQEITGYWRGISVYSNSVENEISHTQIRYAGSTEAGIYFDAAALTVDQAKVQLSHVTIANSGQYGIQTRRTGAEFPMDNMVFNDNEAEHTNIHISQIGYVDAASTFDEGFVKAFGGGTTHDMTISALDGAKYQIVNNVDFEHEIDIQEGAEFEFGPDAGIVVKSGAVIKAMGTSNNKIVFTGTSKVAGSWQGVFIGSSSVDNVFEHVDISYGGSSDIGIYFDKANMAIDQGKINLRNVSFTGSAGYGIQTRRNGSDFTIENCTFNDNAESHMLIHPTQVDFVDNQTNFNGGVVEVYGGDTEDSGNETWSNLNNGAFYFSGSVNIDNSVSIQAGALFEMGTDVKLKVREEIRANGSSDDWIVFTGRSKQQGAWAGILIASSSVENELDYVKIEYGGGADLDIYMDAGNLGVINDSYLNAPNLKVENSANYGIIIRESRDAVMDMGNVTYLNNSNDDLYIY